MVLISGTDGNKRCFGNKPGKEYLAKYHDEEWGVPVYDDRRLFEGIILEGAQAGLSWDTILQRREGYRKAFHNFDPEKVANMSDSELESLRSNPGIIRNKLKIYSARNNAKSFLEIQKKFGSFTDYAWGFVESKPIKNSWKSYSEIPITTAESDRFSAGLKSFGMTFVGSTLMYAFMQAYGMVNDHLVDCWCYRE